MNIFRRCSKSKALPLLMAVTGMAFLSSCVEFDPNIPCNEGYLTLTVTPGAAYEDLRVNWEGSRTAVIDTWISDTETCDNTNPPVSANDTKEYSSPPPTAEVFYRKTLHIGIWDSRIELIGDDCPTVVLCQHEVRSSGGGDVSHDVNITPNSCTSADGLLGHYLISDFSLYQNNTPACNWREEWHTSNSEWSISDGVLMSDHAVNERNLLVWAVPTADADVEVLAKVLTHAKTTSSHAQIHLRSSGQVSNMSSYFVGMSAQNGNDQLLLRSFIGSAVNDLASYSFSYSADSWYWIRFRADGNVLRAKIWAEGSGEPANWHIDVADNDIEFGGWVGVGTYNASDDPHFGWFSVGLGGESAGPPL